MFETTSTSSENDAEFAMTEHDFAALGLHNTAYIRQLTAATAMQLFPELDDLVASETLYSLHAADGTPILLARTYNDALETAEANDLRIQVRQ